MNHVVRYVVLACLLILGGMHVGVAQTMDYLDVAQGYETLNLAIDGDTTSAGLPVSVNRVYRLARGGVYLMNGTIANVKKNPLRIWAADGAGAKPLIIIAATTTGSNYDFASIEGDAHFKNIFISGIDNLGLQNRYTMAVMDSGAKVIFDGVVIDQSRQSHIRSYGMNQKLFFLNCEFSNSIDRATPSNGRFYDARGLQQDSLVWQNCTVYLNTQRMIRMDGAVVKNLIIDHCTFYQNAYGASTTSGTKMSGGFDIAKAIFARITNNIFQDINVEAMWHPSTIVPPDRRPIVYVDSLAVAGFTETERNWQVRNNVYGWSQGFKTFWATIDTVKAPVFISPYGDSAFFRDQPNFQQSNNVERLIAFLDAPTPDSLLKWVQHRFTTKFSNVGNPDPRADRNGFGTLVDNPSSFGPGPDPFNFDYATTDPAYTAGDGGFPLGDLNWFPTKKAEWATWVTSVEDENNVAMTFDLDQNFPNPFNPSTEFRYTLPQSTNVTLTIYNTLGQKVAVVIAGEQKPAGTHSATWLGMDQNGRPASSGVYFYQLATPDSRQTKKMMLVR